MCSIPRSPIDKRPNTWAVRYGDTEWKHFLDFWAVFLTVNGEMERLFKLHMEKLGAAWTAWTRGRSRPACPSPTDDRR